MDGKNDEKKCGNGYHYHPDNLKSDKTNGCMKNEDMKVDPKVPTKVDPKVTTKRNTKEGYNGTFSIYNAVRCGGNRMNDLSWSSIGV